MDFPTGNIKRIYFRYLSAAFGNAMITSVYSIVDMAMVGQYHGPDGTAALAVVAPVWNIIYSLGLLMGIGGSVIFSAKRGAEQNNGEENQYFTMAVLGSVLLAVLAWVGVLAFEVSVLTFFGADETLLAMAQRYMQPSSPPISERGRATGFERPCAWRWGRQSFSACSGRWSAWPVPTCMSASSCSPPSGFWKSPRHHPPVRHLLPLPAPEHLLHLLFPGHHEAQGGVRGLGGPRMRHQRHFDSAPARPDRSGFHLAGHAYHRAGDPALCAHHDETDDQGTDTVRIQG